jgi:hypothetical protein
MKTFYTNVKQYGQKMLVRGIEDGRRFKRKVDYSPYMFVRSQENSEYRSIHGDMAEKMYFENIREAKDFCEKYNDVHGFEIYGMNEFTYPFINDEWAGIVDYDVDLINKVSIDIETMSDDGFPNVELALVMAKSLLLLVMVNLFPINQMFATSIVKLSLIYSYV